jgi:hypothetical protein
LIYLDASVVVSTFLSDVHTSRVMAWLSTVSEAPALSNWTVTEFSSAATAQERMGRITRDRRLVAEQNFDAWLLAVEQAPMIVADFALARDFLRRSLPRLRAGDALHLAVARRFGARVATLDAVMADAALAVGLALEPV